MKLKLNSRLLFDVIRFYLALIFIVYAKNKLMDDQFMVHPYYYDIPLKDVNKFALAWFTFGFEPFNVGIGIVQLAIAVLLIFRRTVLIGAVFYFFVMSAILLIIMTYLEGWDSIVMISKVLFFMLLNLYLIYYYKAEIISFWKKFSVKITRQKFSFRVVLIVFLGMIVLNILSFFAKYLYLIFADPKNLIDTFIFDLRDSYEIYKEIFNRFI